MEDLKKVERRFKYLLYFITILTVLTIILPGMQVGSVVYNHAKKHTVEAVDGKMGLVLEGDELLNQYYLNGEWECYEGVYINTEDEIIDKIIESEGVVSQLPVEDLKDASGQRTYKLQLDIDTSEEILYELALSIEFTNESVKIYLNGNELESYRPIKSWMGGSASYNMYVFEDAYDAEAEYQEILVSINEDPNTTDLYRREIGIGTAGTIIEQVHTQDVLEMFLVGFMLLSIIMGLIYLVMMPSYSVLTFMNLFDAALMLYIYYNICRVPGVISSNLMGEFQDHFLRGQALMMLFIAGALGNILGQVIYDPEKEYSKWFGAPVNAVWFIFAFYYGVFPSKYGDTALYACVLLLLANFIGLGWRIWKCYKSERWNWYLAFHVCKTAFVGVIILIDVLTLNTYPRNETFIVLSYMLYFVIHFFIRAYEYIIPFKQIEKHNEDLERAVEDRTLQLVEANEVLKQINISDSLTKANNRAYFEELLEDVVEKYENDNSAHDLYLCIFDLDNFKVINDTYGHSEGDEQLKELVKVVKELIPSELKISRIGGEEFALIFDGYYEDTVINMVTQIRRKLEVLAEREVRTTGSFGIAKYRMGDMKKNFFINADKCLYHAKANSKNCITHDFEKELTIVK